MARGPGMPGAERELRGQGGCLHVRGACLGRRVRVVVNACPRLRGATLLGTDKGVGLRQRLPPHGAVWETWYAVFHSSVALGTSLVWVCDRSGPEAGKKWICLRERERDSFPG